MLPNIHRHKSFSVQRNCAYMAITLLVGLLLNKLFGWWWADPLAALVLVYFIVKEGREALQEARTGETCDCGGDDCS